jgi:uncharacterized repeat protein (TIGR03803 family)
VNGYGTIYKLTLGGKLTTLHSFNATDAYENTGLVFGGDGNFYGITNGGASSGDGVFFRIAPSGTYTVLYNFCSQLLCADGYNPNALVYGDDGNFYVANNSGGHILGPCAGTGCGTLVRLTPEGVLTPLYVFNGTTGGFGNISLAQATNGIFYGGDDIGGTNNDGAIFALSGLRPFVEVVPGTGKVGATVQILGSNLTGATAVSFNGTASAFEVKSKTLISATVPAGATTGIVTVTGSGGSLNSNTKFYVRP